MKDQLPNRIYKNESMIVNLDNSSGKGTHWICFFKKDNKIYYYDSFGVKPPIQLVEYFAKQNKSEVYYNIDKYQNFDEIICGHLCLEFLTKFSCT